MAQLYDISFTTQKRVVKFDDKGNRCSETKTDTEVRMNSLPYETAKSYSKCDNFEMVLHVESNRPVSRADNWGGPATKKIGDYKRTAKGVKKGELKVIKSDTGGKSKIQEAAATGDMSAAIRNE